MATLIRTEIYDTAIIEVRAGFVDVNYNILLKSNFFKFKASNALEIVVKLEELLQLYSKEHKNDYRVLIPVIKSFLTYTIPHDDFTIQLNFVGINIQTIKG